MLACSTPSHKVLGFIPRAPSLPVGVLELEAHSLLPNDLSLHSLYRGEQIASWDSKSFFLRFSVICRREMIVVTSTPK